jgi:hypothetical protein
MASGEKGVVSKFCRRELRAAVAVLPREHAIVAQHHSGRLGERTDLGAGKRRPAADQIDADLEVDRGAEAVDLGRLIEQPAGRHVGHRHQFVGQLPAWRR